MNSIQVVHRSTLYGLWSLFFLLNATLTHTQSRSDYSIYHQQVLELEELLVGGKYELALDKYEELVDSYPFVFLREHQVATQIALVINKEEKAVVYMQRGIKAGWKWRHIRKNGLLSQLRGTDLWKKSKAEYAALREQYVGRLQQDLRTRVKKMYKKDQRKAFLALLTFGSKGQERYAERRFAPHSEQQIAKAKKILRDFGYPGERLVGNNYWMSTILSHHNSISTDYNQQDTLYASIRPALEVALLEGQMSPFSFALIEDWYLASTRERNGETYGFLQQVTADQLEFTNKRRQRIYLRSVELRNQLVELESKTGMDLFLPGNSWVGGKIEIRE